MISVPESFRLETIKREGQTAIAWLESLPSLVDCMCREWNLAIDGSLIIGYVGLVIPVRRNDESCVLKISWIDDDTRYEADALKAWRGNSAVHLLEHSATNGALLLERLDHTRTLNELPIQEAIVIAATLLRRLAIDAPSAVPTLSDTSAKLERTLPQTWELRGRPMPRRLIDFACEICANLGGTQARLLVNYDLHYENVLGGEREPWIVIDPKVVAGEPEYALAQLFWNRFDEIEASGGIERFFDIAVEAAELDMRRARLWTVVRCVNLWLWGVECEFTGLCARSEYIINKLTRS